MKIDGFESSNEIKRMSDIYEARWRNKCRGVEFRFQKFVALYEISWKSEPMGFMNIRNKGRIYIVVVFKREKFKRDGYYWTDWRFWKSIERKVYADYSCAIRFFKKTRHKLITDEIEFGQTEMED